MARPENKPLPGSDFPKPDSTKGLSTGWDFEKQEYKYYVPNPKSNTEKVYIENEESYDDPYDVLYYYLD